MICNKIILFLAFSFSFIFCLNLIHIFTSPDRGCADLKLLRNEMRMEGKRMKNGESYKNLEFKLFSGM